jgi:hypothetical protein
MGKMMDKRKKMIRGAAIFVAFSAVVVVVHAIKRREELV